MKSILITGASTGIGAHCAVGLEKQGWQVYAGVRSARAGEELASPAGPNLKVVTLEVTDPASVAAAAERLTGELGSLDALWNNAGVTVNGPLEFVPLEDLRRQLEINVIAPVAVLQAFMPLLRPARGRILLTGSVGGFFTTPMLAPYCMSKRALEAMADALRVELRPWGMKVVLLQPGAIATPIWQKGLEAADRFSPPGMEALYGGPMARLRQLAEKEARTAASPDLVLQAVVEALTAKEPRDRYTMGAGANHRRLLARFPAKLRDWLLARALGFHAR